jgi:hypothetical protein
MNAYLASQMTKEAAEQKKTPSQEHLKEFDEVLNKISKAASDASSSTYHSTYLRVEPFIAFLESKGFEVLLYKEYWDHRLKLAYTLHISW